MKWSVFIAFLLLISIAGVTEKSYASDVEENSNDKVNFEEPINLYLIIGGGSYLDTTSIYGGVGFSKYFNFPSNPGNVDGFALSVGAEAITTAGSSSFTEKVPFTTVSQFRLGVPIGFGYLWQLGNKIDERSGRGSDKVPRYLPASTIGLFFNLKPFIGRETFESESLRVRTGGRSFHFRVEKRGLIAGLKVGVSVEGKYKRFFWSVEADVNTVTFASGDTSILNEYTGNIKLGYVF